MYFKTRALLKQLTEKRKPQLKLTEMEDSVP